MFNNIALSLQISVLILGGSSNLLQPEYSIKILNTENIILSLEDFDDDLEIIKKDSEDPELDKKLNRFHKFVKKMEVTERPLEKFFYNPEKWITYLRGSDVSYPDSPFEIAVDRQHLSMLERRKKKNWRKHSKHKRRYKKKSDMIEWKTENRELTTIKDINDLEAEYDYLEKQYSSFLAKSLENNTAYKYSDEGKPEENFKEVMDKITNLKTPKNCTNVTGIGIQAIECVVKNYQNKELDKKDVLNKVSLILLVWFCIYLAVALIFWCTKGWCCCCFRCAFCLPYKTVREIQKYIAQNPPGVYVNLKGEQEHYNPNSRETELYEKIKKSIAGF